jgi:protein-S-isoprenylcysteine O-methyltransferase Ste14
MIAWLNLTLLTFSALLFLYYYVLSVSPAALELSYGPDAYQRCAKYRVVAIGFELITVLSYVVYFYFPVSVPLPLTFPWQWWISVSIALLISVPAMYLMIVGMKDAGEEAVRPRKEHGMFNGIYTKVRHPQAVGEVFIWMVIALLLNSPFLAVFSLLFVPIFLLMCLAEEKDLLLRFGTPYADYLRTTGAFIPKSD